MAVDGVHGKAVRMTYPLPPVEQAERIRDEHVPSPGYPLQCMCGSPYATCWQRLGAVEALRRAAATPGS